MRTCGALALRSPGSRIYARVGCPCPLSAPSLSHRPRRAPAPAPALAPRPSTAGISTNSQFLVRPGWSL
eukprot:4595911-Pleurochrysis_carterae.AAC.1